MPKTTNPFAKKKRTSPATASPLSAFPRIKSGPRVSTKHDSQDRLEDTGTVARLAPKNLNQDVISLYHYIRDHAFDEIPERAAGMGSERIAEILRFRKNLAPIVSIAHLHALSTNVTRTERELASLIALGKFRKVVVPGRGKGGDAIGEGVVLVDEWRARITEDPRLIDEVKTAYTRHLVSDTAQSTVESSKLGGDDAVRELVAAGWITSPAALSGYGLGALSTSLVTSMSTIISKAGHSAATGTLAAVGGHGAIHDHGGGGSMLATKDSRPPSNIRSDYMTFSMPGTGAYLKLMTEARFHLLFLLKQLSPRHKEATWNLLKEKWDGNTLNDAASQLKRARGEFAGVLPGKTRRWREFYGLDFEWVLAECIGSGLMELFDTGSVGKAIRAR